MQGIYERYEMTSKFLRHIADALGDSEWQEVQECIEDDLP